MKLDNSVKQITSFLLNALKAVIPKEIYVGIQKAFVKVNSTFLLKEKKIKFDEIDIFSYFKLDI